MRPRRIWFVATLAILVALGLSQVALGYAAGWESNTFYLLGMSGVKAYIYTPDWAPVQKDGNHQSERHDA